jgi:DNA polymerase
VVLLGGLTAKTLLGRARPKRGDWATLAVPGLEAGVPALAMAHPATVAKSPSQKREAWADLRLLRRTLDSDRAGMNTAL